MKLREKVSGALARKNFHAISNGLRNAFYQHYQRSFGRELYVHEA